MSEPRFCPQCGKPRTEGLSFCGSCGYTFGAAFQATGPSPTPGISGPPPGAPRREPRSGLEKFLILAIVLVALGGVGLLILNNQISGIMDQVGRSIPNASVRAPGNTPPVGEIWFGSSFDPDTMAIRGRTSTIALNAPFSMVARLPKTYSGTDLAIRIYLDGDLLTSSNMSDLPGEGDLWGLTPGPFYVEGSYLYQVTDIGGNVLASGSIVAQ